MIRIVELKPLHDYSLWVRFNDGLEGIYAVNRKGRGGVFTRLCDRSVFQKAALNEQFGCVEWPEGIDLCPTSMHAEMAAILAQTAVAL